MIKKNQKANLDILSLNNDGYGVGKIDNQVVFVPYSLPSEKIEATIINTKNRFAIGKIDKIVISSTNRVAPLCPYFGKCGGCSLQHLNYSKQLEFKTKLVKDMLKKFGNIETEVLPCISSQQWRYRNKIAIPANSVLGMFRKNSHDIIEIDDCIITQEWVGPLLRAFNKYIREKNIPLYNEQTKQGLIKHLVARSLNNQLLITVVITTNNLPNKDKLVEELTSNFSDFGLNININKLNNNVILSNSWKHIYGLKELKSNDFGISYTISNASFMQVNDEIKLAIYEKVLSLITEKETVVDAYSGAGLLSAIVSKKAKRCYGIEIIKEATENANYLAKQNNINNLININGDCGKELPSLVKRLLNENVAVILDPPRKGCSKSVIESLSLSKPNKIIYISCSPDTLSRDLKLLLENNLYKIKFVQPYDMFPNTPHVETIVLLER